MATEAAWLECKESTGRKEKTERANRKRKTHLTHTGLLMEGLMGEDCWRESTWEEWEDFGGFRRNAWRASPGTVTGMQMRHMVRRARGMVPE